MEAIIHACDPNRVRLTVATVLLLAVAQLRGALITYEDWAKVRDTKVIIRHVEQVVHYCDLCICNYPLSLNELVGQKYLKDPLDAWGQPLIFKFPGEHNADGADIVSKGKDKQEGTADDIKNWDF
jgi:hypothetical protein